VRTYLASGWVAMVERTVVSCCTVCFLWRLANPCAYDTVVMHSLHHSCCNIVSWLQLRGQGAITDMFHSCRGFQGLWLHKLLHSWKGRHRTAVPA
jgi:hypothetical protein